MSVTTPSTANVTDLSGQQASSGGSLTQAKMRIDGIVQNPAQTSCTTLIFNVISVTEITGGLAVNFVCPVCGATWSLTFMFDDYDGSGTYDMNELINTAFPDHNDPTGNDCSFGNAAISLFLAAHLDSNGFYNCMQKSSGEGADGIPDNWWSLLEAEVPTT
jgi:hypothetical protein